MIKYGLLLGLLAFSFWLKHWSDEQIHGKEKKRRRDIKHWD